MSTPAISTEAYLFIEVRDRVYKYRFSTTMTSVGSAEDNNVRIKEPSVAQHHLLVTYVDGHFHLRRAGDAAVHLNGERLENWSEELRWGDVVRIGDVRLRLAEGGKTSDSAVLLLASLSGDPASRPWQAWVTRKREFTLGGGKSDLLLPGFDSPQLIVENYGAAGCYAMPIEGVSPPSLDEVPIARRTRIKDRAVLRLGGTSLRARLLRGEVMDDPEALMWPDALKRFSLPDPQAG